MSILRTMFCISELNKSRIIVVDIAKSLCILEIVALWHMFSYIKPIEPHYSLLYITQGVLACFTFLSGLFNGKKRLTIPAFYRSRLIRFFPLLCLSLLYFYIGGRISLQTFLFSLCGISCFIGTQPITLWFFSMIVFLYIVTPLLTYRLDISNVKKDWIKFMARSAALYAVLLTIHLMYQIDERLLYYFPFYIAGIICPFRALGLMALHKVKFLTISTIVLFILLTSNHNLLIINALIWGGVILAILSFSAIVEQISCKAVKKLFFIISYAGMCAYLFHRQIYAIFKQMVAGGNNHYLSYTEATLMVCCLFVLAYAIQYCYDCLIKKMNRH